MITCCIDGCEAQGTVHAEHEGASHYCETHGVCPRCGESVAYFRLRGAHWFCPCMIDMQLDNERILRELAQKKQDAEKNLAQFVIPRANKRKVRKAS